MRRSGFIAITIALAAILWVMSGSITDEKKISPAEIKPDAEAPVVKVRVRDLEAKPVAGDIVTTGRTHASRQVDLRAETAGQVAEVIVSEGAAIKQGDVIVRLEERDRRARVTEAKERIRQRETEYNAARSLEKKGFNSRIKLTQASADLEAARAELKKAEADLKNIEIKAPFDGIAYGKDVETGDYVSIGDHIFSVINLDPIEITGFVSEKQVHGLATGQGARAVMVDGETVVGNISYVAPAADPSTRTFEIKMTASNPDGRIAQGMTAELHIAMPETMAHEISPAILALNDEGHLGVKILDTDSKVKFVSVTIVSDSRESMWIEGLPKNARVITVGQEFVIEGQKVEAVEADGDGLL